MDLQGITLSASARDWRLFMVRKADPAFLSFQSKVFARDQYTCQYCGFQAQEHQEVVNRDGNCSNNRLDNLNTACIFCTQCFFLEAIGKSDFGGGTLICLPEMSQGELNALCHVLFAAMVSGNAYSHQAKNIYRSLRLRSQIVEKQLGEGMSNPALYGHMLIDANVEDKDKVNAEVSSTIRVLPQLSRFVSQVEAWELNGLKALSFISK